MNGSFIETRNLIIIRSMTHTFCKLNLCYTEVKVK